MDLPATVVLDLPVPGDLFVPVVRPVEPATAGLGHAFGAGRRIRRRAGRGADAVELIGDPVPRSWRESAAYVELERAVDEVFADVEVARPSTAELIRPYIEHADSGSVWAGVGIVPPPTPVHGVSGLEVSGLEVSGPEVGGPEVDRPGDRESAASGRPGPLPSRRELRQRRKAEESSRSAATRRLAKGGVLAVAMFGAVASQAPQALHEQLFGAAPALGDAAAASLAVSVGTPVDTTALVRDGVEETLRQRLAKTQQVQLVSDAAQDAGVVLVAVAKAQAATDAAERKAALDRATRRAQRNPQALARIMVGDRGWSPAQFECLNLLWARESRWDYRATNPSSGAYGIPQALPGSKMARVGSDWRTNPATQISWGLGYIADRYGTPCGAWNHSQSYNWY